MKKIANYISVFAIIAMLFACATEKPPQIGLWKLDGYSDDIERSAEEKASFEQAIAQLKRTWYIEFKDKKTFVLTRGNQVIKGEYEFSRDMKTLSFKKQKDGNGGTLADQKLGVVSITPEELVIRIFQEGVNVTTTFTKIR